MTRPLIRLLTGSAILLSALMLGSCSSSSSGVSGVPEHLPNISLNPTVATPPHSMPSYEYPFDSKGNYVSEWAAEGERRAGRSASYTSDDESKWSGSHGGHATTTRKVAKKESNSGDDPPSKKKSASTAKTTASYTVGASDTLYGISRKFGVSVEAIKRANGLKSDIIHGGMTLKIPK
jgi:LysM repeat protein